MIGLTLEGFAVESPREIYDDLILRLRNRIGASLTDDPRSGLGIILAAVADRVAACQELAQAIYAGGNPDTATGDALVSLAALTGTLPLPPTPSAVTLTLTGTLGTVVAAGKLAESASLVFELQSTATLLAVPAFVTSFVYTVGDRRHVGGNVYQCTVAGDSALVVPSGTGSVIVCGASVWRWLGAGVAVADVDAQALDVGPNAAPSGTVNLIKTPVGGWSGVINLLDADLGRSAEPDESLRLRRSAELASGGSHSINALRADLLRYLAGTNSTTQQVTIFENKTDVVNAAGMPPHTVECLIRGGVDQAIALLLLDAIGVCYATHGNISQTVQDSQGFDHVVKFSRPALINVYAAVTLVKDPTLYPLDGDAQVIAAIIAYGDAQRTGRDAVGTALASRVFTVPGVLDCTVLVAASPIPSLASLPIALRELAVYDSSRITVVATDGVP